MTPTKEKVAAATKQLRATLEARRLVAAKLTRDDEWGLECDNKVRFQKLGNQVVGETIALLECLEEFLKEP